MKSVLKTGVCVSCGREPGRRYRICPYCGEAVWRAPGWRVAAAAIWIVAPLSLLALVIWARPDAHLVGQLVRTLHPAAAYALAAGLGVSLLPCDDSARVVSSRSELLRFQAACVSGSVSVVLAAAVATVCLLGWQAPPAASWALAIGVYVCVAATPHVFCVPWRAALAAGLVTAALVLG